MELSHWLQMCLVFKKQVKPGACFNMPPLSTGKNQQMCQNSFPEYITIIWETKPHVWPWEKIAKARPRCV